MLRQQANYGVVRLSLNGRRRYTRHIASVGLSHQLIARGARDDFDLNPLWHKHNRKAPSARGGLRFHLTISGV